MEYGIESPRGVAVLRRRLAGIVEDAENELSGVWAGGDGTVETARPRTLRALGAWATREELRRLDERVKQFDAQIVAISQAEPACQRLQAIPGIGPLTATALVAAVGDAAEFRSGRELSAWLGLVPRQYSTGGRPRLTRHQ